MWRKTLLTAGIAAALIAAFTFAFHPSVGAITPVYAAATPAAATGDRRTISVNGQGQVAVTPDMATVTFGVESSGTDLVATQGDNATRTQATIDKLKGQGIDAKDLQTTGYNVQPQYDRDQKLTGYKVTNTVRATVRDLSKLGSTIDAAVGAGTNRVSGISFDVANKAEALKGARQAAVADARQKADLYAQLTNTTLGGVLTLSESVATPDYRTAAPAAAPASGVTTTPIEAGQGSITITVDVVYEIQ
jgi:uncharacterized protein YggE